MKAEGSEIPGSHSFDTLPDKSIRLKNGNEESRILLLQGKPIKEPVAQYGPFVMNTNEEINQAIADYRVTQFGGWPWPTSEPVHSAEAVRFARYADGKVEKKNSF